MSSSINNSPDLDRPAIFDLSARTRLLVSGADRLRYLNGQVTQDLRKLRPGTAVPACVTTAKGRLQADVWVSILGTGGECMVVDAVPELRETLKARLERYIVADDVTLEDVTAKSGLLHCIGVSPAEHPLLKEFPMTSASRLGAEGFDVYVPAERLEAVKTGLADLLVDEKDWLRIRIERGIPEWGAELGEDTLPPEALLDATHIDYHKGCYIGQEVISRIKSVGHVNRTLCKWKGVADQLPAPGSRFYSGDGTEAGMLTSIIATRPGEFKALGYLKRGQAAESFSTDGGGRLECVD